MRYINHKGDCLIIHHSDRKNDACGGLRLRIPILFTISVLLGAIAFPGLRKYRTR
ncbi:hypothetical protein [Nostoc sp.]|uniref:hypothetical protein n=1 Tax=Nostoc sp. TaxID=1180 RepID=UPI002FF0BA3C